MKKYLPIIIVILGITVFLLGFNYKNINEPNTFYQVYLDDEVIGVISSKEELEKYIDKEEEQIKRKFGLEKVYAPNGLEIKKITTYNEGLTSVKDIYDIIKEKKAFTIKGYQITIRQEVASAEEDGDDKTVSKINKYYVLKKETFSEAVESMIKIFVGSEKYEAYVNKTQEEIKTIGSFINDIYLDGDKTIKEMQIPVTEDIYTDIENLTHDLVYGKESNSTKYVVQIGDTIEKIAFNNKISVEEFLISNPEFTNKNNLLYANQEVVIAETNPQLSVVMLEYSVEDKESNYGQVIEEDATMTLGNEVVKQPGEKGLDRVSQTNKYVNGALDSVRDPSKEVLKAPVDEIILRGTHYVPNIGSTTSWGWPTNSGWTITSGYSWRTNPINGQRELHDGIDIAGTGWGSPVYATNTGDIVVASYKYIYGNFIIFNHFFGYFTYYGHMSSFNNVKVGQVVARGETIGFVGDTGWATGAHVHYSIWRGYPWRNGSTTLNPLTFY